MTVDNALDAPEVRDASTGRANRFLLRDLPRQRNLFWVLIAMLPVLLPFLILVGTGIYGLDFGYHWDEGLLLTKVQRSIDSGLLLPEDFYNYPSMSYWLTFLGSGFEIIPAIQSIDTNVDPGQIATGDALGIRSQWSAQILSQANLLRVRGVFLIVSALTIVWVYLLQLIWRKSWAEALLAASILAFSWQVAYHLRWIAPDAVLMQFVALTTLLVMLVRLRPDHDRLWLRLAAIAAGLACGTKYQAGLLLVPIFIASYQSWDKDSIIRGLLPRAIEVLLIFGLTYLITTPGTVLTPVEFVRDVVFEINHYRYGVSYIPEHNNVSAGLEHLLLIGTFLARTLFSQYDLLAIVFFIFAVLGIAALFLESRSLALLFLSTPVLYILAMSSQIVFILRNLQVLAPFFAILSARGIVLIYERLHSKYLRIGLAIIVALFLSVNAYWLIHASETIHNRNPERFAREAASYIESHPETRFFVSDRVWNDLSTLGKADILNVTRNPDEDVDAALFYLLEGRVDPLAWPIDRHDLLTTWFGPWEVDLNHYSTWQGDDRILLMPMDTAREIGVVVVE